MSLTLYRAIASVGLYPGSCGNPSVRSYGGVFLVSEVPLWRGIHSNPSSELIVVWGAGVTAARGPAAALPRGRDSDACLGQRVSRCADNFRQGIESNYRENWLFCFFVRYRQLWPILIIHAAGLYSRTRFTGVTAARGPAAALPRGWDSNACLLRYTAL